MSDIASQANATLSAFFNHRHDAEKAIDRLVEAGIPQSSVRLLPGNESDAPVDREESHGGFFGALAGFFMPDEDRHAYAEGLTRGGYLVAVSDVAGADYDRALAILDDEGAVDFDQAEQGWRAEGWSGFASGADGTIAAGTATAASSSERTAALGGQSRALADGETIPVVEESLQVGKRDVNLGRVRVRSYLRETPVSEQVKLRDERVTLERRPVDRAIDANDSAFQDRTIEAEEHSEEAVVAKTARVVEEIGLRKDSTERNETISDTVRKTEVEIEDERDDIIKRRSER